MITDEDIKIKYVDTLERIQGQKLKYMTKEESEYLQNRYSDSDSIKETIFRIFYNVEIKPKCNCDFYIPSLDLFIEFQGYYTHGKHPFNSNSKDDLKLIEQYKEKYDENCQAITIWTIKDPEKRRCAKEHNLNWKEFFTIDELKDWLENG